MSGRSFRAYFSFGGPPSPAVYLGADWKRLSAALMVSCALHGGLVLMPYFGTSTTAFRPVARGAQNPGTARVLSVRLRQASEPAATAAGTPAAGASAANQARPRVSEEPRPAANRARGTELLPIPAATYYTADQLTKHPRPTSNPKLNVPREIARTATGKVVLRLWINELGNVDSVEVERSSLPEGISGMASAAFGKLRFLPGEIDGRSVRSLMRIEVTYVNGKRPPP